MNYEKKKKKAGHVPTQDGTGRSNKLYVEDCYRLSRGLSTVSHS